MHKLTEEKALHDAEALAGDSPDPAVQMQAAQVLMLAALARHLAFIIERLEDIEVALYRLNHT
jgi:hypothetical protein